MHFSSELSEYQEACVMVVVVVVVESIGRTCSGIAGTDCSVEGCGSRI